MSALANQDTAAWRAKAAVDAWVIASRLRGFAVAADFITSNAHIEQGLDEAVAKENIAAALSALHEQMAASAADLEGLLERLSLQLGVKT